MPVADGARSCWRRGALAIGGIAPALRGGALVIGGIAPALRGGAMSIALAGAVAAAAVGCDAFAESSRGGGDEAVPPTTGGGSAGRPGIPPFAGMPTGPVACPASAPANGAQCFGMLLCTFTATDPPCGEAAMQLALCWNGVWDVDVLATRDCGPVVVPDAGPDEDAGGDEDAGS